MKGIKAKFREAELYREQGLLEESLQAYQKCLKLLEGQEDLSENSNLIPVVRDKIRIVENQISELDLDADPPELPQEIQNLISRLFSFSKNQDIAAIEGAMALAEFGQYEKSLSELQRFEREGMHVKMEREVVAISSQLNSIVTHLRDSYKYIREQGVQISRYAKELSRSYRRLREEQDLRNVLSRYLGQNLVEKVVKSKGGVLFETERKEVTVLFADIRSFTSLSERMAAEDLVTMLNEFFTEMVEVVFRNSGILDKFVGDELMAVFGHLSSGLGSPCDQAVRAAVEMQTATQEMMRSRKKEGKQTFEIGIGVNTGNAVIGNVGSKNRMDYTVIGDCVNTAARFQQLAKGGEIIIGEQTHRALEGDFRIRRKWKIKLKNKTKPLVCYSVTG